MPELTFRTCRFVPRLVLAAVVGVLTGCAGRAPEPDRIVTTMPDDGEKAPRSSALTLSAEGAVVRASPHAVYDSGSSTSTRRLRVERTRLMDDQPGVTAWSVLRMPMQDGADLPAKRSELTMRLNPEGDAVLLRTLEAGDNVITTFEPGMLVLPGRLEPGQTRTRDMKMIVHPLSHPDQVQSSGDATVTIEHLGAEALQTPMGRLDATKVRSTLRAKLGEAQVENTTTSWFVPGMGMIAEDRRETVTVMGLVIRRGGESWVIAEAQALTP